MRPFWIVYLLVVSTELLGQTRTFSIDSCLVHAYKQNLQIVISENEFGLAVLESMKSRNEFLPVVEGGISHGYNWGQRIDPFTNEFASDRVQTSGAQLNGRLILFSGNSKLNNLRTSQIGLEQGKRSIELKRADVYELTLNAFVSVLIAQTEYRMASEDLSSNDSLLSRVKAYVNLGILPMSDLIRLDVIAKEDSIRIIKTHAEAQRAMLALSLLIRASDFKLEDSLSEPLSKPPCSDSLRYEFAKYESERLEYQLKAVKGQFSPSVAITGSLGSGYSGNNVEYTGLDPVPKPYKKQLVENLYQSANIEMSIPIFKARAVSTQVKELEIRNELADNNILDLQNKLIYNLSKRELEIVSIEAELFVCASILAQYVSLEKIEKDRYLSGEIDMDIYFASKQLLRNTEKRIKLLEYKHWLLKHSTCQ